MKLLKKHSKSIVKNFGKPYISENYCGEIDLKQKFKNKKILCGK